eukprot:365192-Chlamydomonas_euryale.AAC.26
MHPTASAVCACVHALSLYSNLDTFSSQKDKKSKARAYCQKHRTPRTGVLTIAAAEYWCDAAAQMSHLTDPEAWMKNTLAFYNAKWDGPKTFKELSRMYGGISGALDWEWTNIIGPRTFGTALWTSGDFSTSFTEEDIKQKLAGDPIVDGKSTAKVWYTVMTPGPGPGVTPGSVPNSGDYIAFVYGLFYPWNGCSNQLLALNIDGKYQGAEYYMCAKGVHEGDLEHIKQLACIQDLIDLLDSPDPRVNASSVVKKSQMSQHSWIQELNCENGECPTEVGDDGIERMVAYAGLHSHANYPAVSPLQVYSKVSLSVLANLDGLYISDRTSASGPVFIPDENNTKRIPYSFQMNESDVETFRWALYPGESRTMPQWLAVANASASKLAR